MEVLHSLEDNLWFSRLWSAVRTGIACLLVLFLSSKCIHFMKFTVFAYVMAITILGESYLGKCLMDTCSLMKGTLQSTLLSLIILPVIGPQNFTLPVSLTCLFFTSFAFSYYPTKPSDPVRKRIALALSSIVYVSSYINPHGTNAVWFPIKLAITTLLGTSCAILALILPVPRLAAYQIRCKTQEIVRLVSKNFVILVDAFDEPEHLSALLEAKCIATATSKSIAYIFKKHEEAEWEPKFLHGGVSKIILKRISSMNNCLMGMTMALEKRMTSHAHVVYQKDSLHELSQVREWIKLGIEEVIQKLNTGSPSSSGTLVKGMDALLSLEDTIMRNYSQDCSFERMFFLFNVKQFVIAQMQLLQNDCSRRSDNIKVHSCEKSQLPSWAAESCDAQAEKVLDDVPVKSGWTCKLKEYFQEMKVDRNAVLGSFKIALSLVFAVCLGVWYKKELGYWSTITVALGLYNTRTGTFKTTSLRIHGTAIGTIYGYLVALITHQAVLPTVVALLPWLLFTSFMRESKLFGLSGASSAFSSSVIILGKIRPGPVQNFTIIRVTQAVLGLSIFLIVEALIFPRRAAALARSEVSHNLGILRTCIQEVFDATITTVEACEKCFDKRLSELEQKLVKLKAGISHLRALVLEARVEPDFWHSPFSASSFAKLADVQARIVDLLHPLLLSAKSSLPKQFRFTAKTIQCELQVELDCLSEFWQLRNGLYKKKLPDVESQATSSSSIRASVKRTFEDAEMLQAGDTPEAKVTFGTFAFCSQELLSEMQELKMTVMNHMQEEQK